jgi:hypothetical protein
MELERYNTGNTTPKKRKRRVSRKFLLIVVFFLALAIIFLSTFSFDFLKTIPKNNLNSNNSFYFSSQTGIPEINLKGDYSRIVIGEIINSELALDGKTFSLESSKNNLEIYDFSGKIFVDENFVRVLEGKSSRVILNGIPVTSEGNKRMKLFLNSPAEYTSLEIQEEIALSGLNFQTSGKINLEKDVLFLDYDFLTLEGFFGKLSLRNSEMFLEGLTKKLEIRGQEKFLSISK